MVLAEDVFQRRFGSGHGGRSIQREFFSGLHTFYNDGHGGFVTKNLRSAGEGSGMPDPYWGQPTFSITSFATAAVLAWIVMVSSALRA